jgi:hypothetical protein
MESSKLSVPACDSRSSLGQDQLDQGRRLVARAVEQRQPAIAMPQRAQAQR